MSDELAVLSLSGTGGISVSDALDVLSAIEHAYNSVWTLLSILEEAEKDPIFRFWFYPFGPRRGPLTVAYLSWPPEPAQIATLVPRHERLILHAVRLGSPGSWEFLGILSVLEVIRKYLNDRSQRKKDRKYRDAAEQQKLKLENERAYLRNELLKNKIIEQRLQTLRKYGYSERDWASLVNMLLLTPLEALDHYQDTHIIGEAEIKPYAPSD